MKMTGFKILLLNFYCQDRYSHYYQLIFVLKNLKINKSKNKTQNAYLKKISFLYK